MQAINYVNKIKNRFARDPETYKAFLEILQTYQKEGRAIQDVYAQVTTLFHAAPDLLDEFKQFLPDTSAQPEQPQSQPMAPQGSNGSGAGLNQRGGLKRVPAPSRQRDEPAANGANKKAKVAKQQPAKVDDKGKQSKRPGLKEGRSSLLEHDYNNNNNNNNNEHQLTDYPGHMAYAPSYPPNAYAAHAPLPVYAYEVPAPAPPPQPIVPAKPQASTHDIAFFGRVKTHTNDPATYHEFLKLLNLYTQDIIDLTALVSRAFLFLGADAQLWADFREIVGWTEGQAVGEPGGRIDVVDGVRMIENVPSLDGPRRSKGDVGKGWKAYGPSYRQLPQSEISLECSGRDALCWDVLNDEWVSQPSWANDEGFVNQRRNQFEEAMHRSEEERHEYDYHIEANLRTIALLEPIATRIAIMEQDERATFRLKPGLGNQSKSIYQRVIKKVYGREQGNEVIQALHENPCVAVPIVLARLKQKDDEWKRALREWNRVWVESDAKNYVKSLDHQGIALKASDKRVLTNKALVSDIETIKRVQHQRAVAEGRIASRPRTQYSFDLSDRDTFGDAIKLIFSFLDRTSSLPNADKDKVEAFLRRVFPIIFAMSPAQFAAEVVPLGRDDDSESLAGTSDAGTASAIDEIESGSVGSSRRALGKRAAADLRKKVLKNTGGAKSGKKSDSAAGGRRSKVSSPAPVSRAASPTASPAGTEAADVTMADVAGPDFVGAASLSSLLADVQNSAAQAAEAEGAGAVAMTDDQAASPSLGPAEGGFESRPGSPEAGLPELIVPIDEHHAVPEPRRLWNFFASSNLYCLVRLVQTVFHRLMMLKGSAAVVSSAVAHEPITEQHVPSLSPSLTLVSPEGGLVGNASVYYQRALGLCEKLFEGELDQGAFEEAVRRIYGTQGFMLYTLDKLLVQVVKNCQACLADGRSMSLVELGRFDRAHPERGSEVQQVTYRTQAETSLGPEENLYRLEWVPEKWALGIQLLGKDQ